MQFIFCWRWLRDKSLSRTFWYSINSLWCSRREQECFAHPTKGEAGLRCEDFNGLPEVLVKAPFGDSEEVIVGVVDAGEVGGRD